MSFLVNKYEEILQELSRQHVTLVAVSKTKTKEDILEAYHAGHRDFGENYVQELLDKYEQLPKDIRWHFIGHLQTNKVKYLAPFIHLIHSVDSEKLLTEIGKQAAKNARHINCLLQVHIATEETKFGLDEAELESILAKFAADPVAFSHISINGMMGMASFSDDKDLVISEFKKLKSLYERSKERFVTAGHPFSILSMGMSGDYRLAIAEGSTMVRIGSMLFGARS